MKPKGLTSIPAHFSSCSVHQPIVMSVSVGLSWRSVSSSCYSQVNTSCYLKNPTYFTLYSFLNCCFYSAQLLATDFTFALNLIKERLFWVITSPAESQLMSDKSLPCTRSQWVQQWSSWWLRRSKRHAAVCLWRIPKTAACMLATRSDTTFQVPNAAHLFRWS